MRVSKELRKKLVTELRYCADKMAKERDLRKKIYFYSNVSESVDSALDFEYDSQLVLMQLVLEVSSSTIAHRIDEILSEKDTSIELLDGLFDRLYSCLNELAACLEENQDTYKALEKITELTHATTQRGYYLYTRGLKETSS